MATGVISPHSQIDHLLTDRVYETLREAIFALDLSPARHSSNETSPPASASARARYARPCSAWRSKAW